MTLSFASKPKTEKIYKFVYEKENRGYFDQKKTMLLTAHSPVEAVKKFNKMTKDALFNIVEFTEVVHKTEESKE